MRKTSRRTFIKGTGALIVTFSWAGALPQLAHAAQQPLAQGAPAAPPPAPVDLNGWIKIQGDGSIKVFTGKVELGQGNQTALSQIVAEELDVPFSSIDMTMGDTAITPNQGPTLGSSTIRSGGAQLRQAAAEARQALLGLAAKKFNVSADSLTVANGVVSAPGGASAAYADLIGNDQFHVDLKASSTPFGLGPLMGTATPKDPSTYTLVGTSVQRPDIVAKVTGQFTYMQDLVVPGMVHARVVHPAGIQSHLVSIDGMDPAVPGAQVVHQGDFVAVIADNEWDAIQGAANLKVTWSDWNGLPDMSQIDSVIRGTPGKDDPAVTTGDAAGAIANAATGLSTTYETPFEMHGSIGPSCAIADVQADKATIWSPYQGPHQLAGQLAQLLQLDPANIHVIYYEGAGCYGGNGHPVASAEAAVLSQMVGKPVRLQWMRQDEHGWELKGPAMVQDLSGGLDGDGNLVAYQHTVWTPPHYASSFPVGDFIGRWDGAPIVLGAFNTPVLVYDLPNVQIVQHNQSYFANAIRSAWLRSPAQFQHTFAMESFIDELAAAAGADPVEFRLRYLNDDRLKAALNAVAQAANWDTRPSPGPNANASGVVSGRGVAVVNRDGTLVAEIAQVQVDKSSGNIQVTQFWAAHDCGLIINPKAVQAQVESNIIQATSRTLKEEVTFDASNVTSLDWRSYPILTYPEVPQITTILLNQPTLKSTGAGEAASNPVPAAIGNAVFDATGIRLRSLPLKPDRVLNALQAVASA